MAHLEPCQARRDKVAWTRSDRPRQIILAIGQPGPPHGATLPSTRSARHVQQRCQWVTFHTAQINPSGSAQILTLRGGRWRNSPNLLAAARSGDQQAAGEAFSVLYAELHKLARSKLRQHQSMTLLDTTSLLHESYLRLVGAHALPVSDRHHFFAYAARVMRSVIVDFARARLAERRGGDADRLVLDTHVAADVANIAAPEHDVLRVHDALDVLAKADRAAGAGGRDALLRRHDRSGDRGGAGHLRAHGAARLGEGAAAAVRHPRVDSDGRISAAATYYGCHDA